MKKRSLIIALAISVAMCFGAFQSVFADTWSEKPTEKQVEDVTYHFMDEVNEGKYKVVSTDTLKSWIDKGTKMVIVDTMPAESSYNKRHVPGAINAEAPMKEEDYSAEQKANLIKQLPTKTVKKTTWKKVSKSTYKKLGKSSRKVKTVKGKKTYYKKVVKKSTVKDKNYRIVVYCGHIGCPRSHWAAKYLVKQGYKNVYRYGGGISAWAAAGYGTEAVTEAAE